MVKCGSLWLHFIDKVRIASSKKNSLMLIETYYFLGPSSYCFSFRCRRGSTFHPHNPERWSRGLVACGDLPRWPLRSRRHCHRFDERPVCKWSACGDPKSRSCLARIGNWPFFWQLTRKLKGWKFLKATFTYRFTRSQAIFNVTLEDNSVRFGESKGFINANQSGALRRESGKYGGIHGTAFIVNNREGWPVQNRKLYKNIPQGKRIFYLQKWILPGIFSHCNAASCENAIRGLVRNFNFECKAIANANSFDLLSSLVDNWNAWCRSLGSRSDAETETNVKYICASWELKRRIPDHVWISDGHHAEGDVPWRGVVRASDLVDFIRLRHDDAMALNHHGVRVNSILTDQRFQVKAVIIFIVKIVWMVKPSQPTGCCSPGRSSSDPVWMSRCWWRPRCRFRNDPGRRCGRWTAGWYSRWPQSGCPCSERSLESKIGYRKYLILSRCLVDFYHHNKFPRSHSWRRFRKSRVRSWCRGFPLGLQSPLLPARRWYRRGQRARTHPIHWILAEKDRIMRSKTKQNETYTQISIMLILTRSKELSVWTSDEPTLLIDYAACRKWKEGHGSLRILVFNVNIETVRLTESAVGGSRLSWSVAGPAVNAVSVDAGRT